MQCSQRLILLPLTGPNPVTVSPLLDIMVLLGRKKTALNFLPARTLELKWYSTTRKIPCVAYHSRFFNGSKGIAHFLESTFPEPSLVPAAYGLQSGPRLCST